jgi:hypothetical protein
VVVVEGWGGKRMRRRVNRIRALHIELHGLVVMSLPLGSFTAARQILVQE